MWRLIATQAYQKDVEKIRDKTTFQRLQKQVEKILKNPQIGKPMRYNLKGERSVRVAPFRLIYKVEGETIFLLRFEHRDKVY